jgi:hypothetical protein
MLIAYLTIVVKTKQVTVAARSQAWSVPYAGTGIMGSNPGKAMNFCPRLSVLRCLVYVEVFQRADQSSKKSCQMFV